MGACFGPSTERAQQSPGRQQGLRARAYSDRSTGREQQSPEWQQSHRLQPKIWIQAHHPSQRHPTIRYLLRHWANRQLVAMAWPRPRPQHSPHRKGKRVFIRT